MKLSATLLAVTCACASAFTLPGAMHSALAPMAARQVTSAPLALRGPAAAARTRRVGAQGAVCQSRAEPAADTLPIGLSNEDYIAFGLAQCYTMTDGKLSEYWVLEPLTGATLECITQGIETSYKRAMALTAGEVLIGGVDKPTGINIDALGPLIKDEDGHLCDDALQRTLAAGRTLKRRTESQVIPVGEVRDGYNFDPAANKRVLNAVKEVNDDDNVKQDMSIDAYGRDKPEPGNLGEMV